MCTIREALAAAGPPPREAEALLLHCLGRDRAWLYANKDAALTGPALDGFLSLNQRRCRGEPLAYLIGSQGFWSLELQVNEAVLIPRPDSEILVQWSLELLRSKAVAAEILDLGTGSGAIALALASESPAAAITAVDASEPALAVARSNGERLQCHVEWLVSDWFSALPRRRWSLIVSNPPYIANNDPHLASLGAEPRSAFVAGPEGLDCIDKIISESPAHLEPGGWLLLEHGYEQGAQVRERLHAGGFTGVDTRLDLAGRARVSGGTYQ